MDGATQPRPSGLNPGQDKQAYVNTEQDEQRDNHTIAHRRHPEAQLEQKSQVLPQRPPKPARLNQDEVAQREQIQKGEEELTFGKDDIIIAIMGVTGAGKSTFIALLSNEEIKIGHGLQSCTMSVGVYHFMLGEVRVWLIDTPGFDDTNRSDSEVLKDVAFWLAAAYSKETRLAGIIYLHRITDVRMLGSALRNLRMFKQLCGANNLDSVILATTHWTDREGKPIPETLGQERTKELVETDEFWGGMIEKGSRMERHDGTMESARNIVSELVDRHIQVVLDIQRQLVDDKKILYDTDAGQALQSELIEERKRSEAKLAELQLDMEDALIDKDVSWQKRIAKETSKLEADVAKKVAEGEEMKINMQKIMEERDGKLQQIIEKMDQDRQHYNEERVLMESRFKEECEKGKVDQREANRHAAAMKKQADDHALEMANLDLEQRIRSRANPKRWFGNKYRP